MAKVTTDQLLNLEVENIENELAYIKEVKSNTQKILDRRIRFLKNRLEYLNKRYGVGHSHDKTSKQKTTAQKINVDPSTDKQSAVYPGLKVLSPYQIKPIDNGSITNTDSATN